MTYVMALDLAFPPADVVTFLRDELRRGYGPGHKVTDFLLCHGIFSFRHRLERHTVRREPAQFVSSRPRKLVRNLPLVLIIPGFDTDFVSGQDGA